MHRSHGAPLGKLYNKFHNWKNNNRSASEKNPEPKAKKSITQLMAYEESSTDQDHIRALKHENLSFEDKLMHWKGCVTTRLNSLNKLDVEGKQIAALWPLYKEPSGYIMVNCISRRQ